jgi:guanylate kinase
MPLLEQRLRGRGTESEKDILKRLSAAQRELEYGTAAGNFDRIIVNDDLESAFDELSETLRDWFPRLKT